MVAQALREAAADAKPNADAIAAGLGLKVVRVLSAEQVTSEEGDFGFAMRKKAPAPPPPGTAPATPIEVGTIEVSATVTLRVEVGP